MRKVAIALAFSVFCLLVISSCHAKSSSLLNEVPVVKGLLKGLSGKDEKAVNEIVRDVVGGKQEVTPGIVEKLLGALDLTLTDLTDDLKLKEVSDLLHITVSTLQKLIKDL